MNIKDLTDKYRVSSSSLRDAQNLAAEEIVLSKIAPISKKNAADGVFSE